MDRASAADAGIGHNRPPATIFDRLSDELRADDLLKRVEELAERANKGPREIKSEDDLDACGQLSLDAAALSKELEAARVDEKRPYLETGREIDAFFATPIDRLKRIRTAFENVASAHLRAVAERKRREAEEAARKAREEESKRLEAARKAEEANRLKTAVSHQDKAIDASQRAEEAEVIAAAPVEDLTRTTTASGIAAKGKTEWDFEIEDYQAIPFDRLRMLLKRAEVEAAIMRAIKNGERNIPGVRIFERVVARFR